jgi:hypothetical protein
MIRAYTYERGTTVPLPKLLIHNLLRALLDPMNLKAFST